MEPKIIFEDNHIIVAIKPHNVATQEDSSNDPDMLTILKDFIKKRDNKPGNVFMGLVHRLDRPTGGVMVFAKTSKAAARLTEQLKVHDMRKKYLCVVNGKPQLAQNRLLTFLKKDEKTNIVKIAPRSEEGSKEAILEYKVIETKSFSKFIETTADESGEKKYTKTAPDERFSLIEVNLITGRSHQIRVQMAKQNNTPIYADFKYGDDKRSGNMALWAYELMFIHPISKQNMVFKVAPDYNNSIFQKFEIAITEILK